MLDVKPMTNPRVRLWEGTKRTDGGFIATRIRFYFTVRTGYRTNLLCEHTRISKILKFLPDLGVHLNIFTVRNSSCRKSMFLQVSVCPRVGGCTPPGPPGQTSPWAPPRQTPHPYRDGHCSGRYASYWNAFLFLLYQISSKLFKL